jgi:hypothetical protein
VNSYVVQIPTNDLYLYLDGKPAGPHTMSEVREMFQNHDISRSSLLWFAGLENWITVGDIPEFDRRVISHSSLPSFPPRADDFIISLKGKVVPLKFETIKSLIDHAEFRRADLVFLSGSDKWVRADQHPKVRELFSNPPPPAVT